MNTKAQHTPGPWILIPGKTLRYCDGASSIEFPKVVIPPNRDGVTEILVYPSKASDHLEAQANARLIAASPKLLAALQRFVSLCPNAEGLGGHAPTGAFTIAADFAREAIAEAMGTEGTIRTVNSSDKL